MVELVAGPAAWLLAFLAALGKGLTEGGVAGFDLKNTTGQKQISY